jgi:hypothetical protein
MGVAAQQGLGPFISPILMGEYPQGEGADRRKPSGTPPASPQRFPRSRAAPPTPSPPPPHATAWHGEDEAGALFDRATPSGDDASPAEDHVRT